jgi:Putative papain-like cysteine peptidase (DUF1796)
MNAMFNKGGCVPISLGFNCHVAMFIEKLGQMDSKFYERQIFDWLGSPMWSVYELVKNDFADFMSPQHMAIRQRYDYKDEKYPVNTKYDMSFLHDFGINVTKIPPNVMGMVSERYGRRIVRMRELLRGSRELLFIRLERDSSDKVASPESAGSAIGETEAVILFADLVKSRGAPYTIVYLTFTEPKGWDAERRICYVHFPKIDPKINFTNDRIMQIVKANSEFIKTCAAVAV